MRLKDDLRPPHAIAAPPRPHPRGVPPLVFESPCARSGGRRQLATDGVRIGLLDDEAVDPRSDVIFICLAVLHGLRGSFPDARAVRPWSEAVHSRPPAVPLTDHRYRGGVGRPDCEMRTRSRQEHASELRVQLRMRTLAA